MVLKKKWVIKNLCVLIVVFLCWFQLVSGESSSNFGIYTGISPFDLTKESYHSGAHVTYTYHESIVNLGIFWKALKINKIDLSLEIDFEQKQINSDFYHWQFSEFTEKNMTFVSAYLNFIYLPFREKNKGFCIYAAPGVSMILSDLDGYECVSRLYFHPKAGLGYQIPLKTGEKSSSYLHIGPEFQMYTGNYSTFYSIKLALRFGF